MSKLKIYHTIWKFSVCVQCGIATALLIEHELLAWQTTKPIDKKSTTNIQQQQQQLQLYIHSINFYSSYFSCFSFACLISLCVHRTLTQLTLTNTWNQINIYIKISQSHTCIFGVSRETERQSVQVMCNTRTAYAFIVLSLILSLSLCIHRSEWSDMYCLVVW